MHLVGMGFAAFGVSVAVYAALESEIEHRGRRAAIGILGLSLFALGIVIM